MKKQIEAIAETVRCTTQAHGADGAKSVYFEIAPAPNMVSFGRGTYLNEMIEITGARNIFAGEERWFSPGPEAIIRANPDVIFTLAGNSAETESAAAEIKSRPGFNTLGAVRQNRIYPIDANSASRPSQNIVLALEEMFSVLK
jgi:iron complex transport system substrate-binding protein